MISNFIKTASSLADGPYIYWGGGGLGLVLGFLIVVLILRK